MKTSSVSLLACAVCLLTPALGFSQITITNSDMPSAGDTLRVSYSLDTVDITTTGANKTWDFSYLTANSQWLEKFDSPSTFTFPFNLLFNPLNTSYGQKQYTPDSIPGLGISMGDAYGFFKKSSSNLKQVGQGLTLNSLPVPFDYNPDDYFYNFPLSYGDVDSCDAEFGPPTVIPLPFYYGQKIHRVNRVDGWGTLITPYGTFQALRMTTTLAIRDTFSDSSGVLAFSFPRPLAYEYKWLKTGGKIPYLQINATDIAGTPVVTNIAYRDSMRGVTQIGINENEALGQGMQVFPNPVKDVALLQYQLQSHCNVFIEVYDINGKLLDTPLSGSAMRPGTHIQKLYLGSYSPGVYLLSLKAGTAKAMKRIVVTD